jgi:hypothetical protein
MKNLQRMTFFKNYDLVIKYLYKYKKIIKLFKRLVKIKLRYKNKYVIDFYNLRNAYFYVYKFLIKFLKNLKNLNYLNLKELLKI